MASLDKRLKEKEKRCQQQEEKIHDMQEESINRQNEHQADMLSQKQLLEHQISELKKRIGEVEEMNEDLKMEVEQLKTTEAAEVSQRQAKIEQLESEKT